MKTAFVLFACLIAAVYSADECLRACPRNLSPVCATFTKTYANECEMKAEACSLAQKNMHLLSNTDTTCQCERACPMNLNPLCATDGKMYDNECMMSVASCKESKWLEVKSQGPCPQK